MGRKARIAGLCAAAAFALLAIHDVPTDPSQDDIHIGDRMLAEAGYSGPKRGFGDLDSFESQLKAIRAVQDTAIRLAALDEEVPFDRPREPRDIYELKKGLCYDRSRTIEKLLAMIGLETRHVSVYSTAKRSALAALVTPGNDSHALTEVMTAKGWMAVDPNVRWLGLTSQEQVVSVAALRSVDHAAVRWAGDGARPHPIFLEPYVSIRGLYSRHGRFYPPYTPIPDVNWRQLMQNFRD